MNKQQRNSQRRIRRHIRVRAKISGTAERPRLAIFRGSAHMHAQLIDDVKGATLAYISDIGKKSAFKGTKMERAKQVGAAIALAAKEKGISKAVFDRGSSVYAGRVRAVAEAAREAGLQL